MDFLASPYINNIVWHDSYLQLVYFIVEQMVSDFSRPGTILLPSGNTFESKIYPLVNKILEEQMYKVPDNLYVSHLDELLVSSIIDKTKPFNLFADAIKAGLPYLLSALNKNPNSDFIDFSSIADFSSRIYDLNVNPQTQIKRIYAGLGADPNLAHFAFIGEDFINREITEINLSEGMQTTHNCNKAITIGTDLITHSQGLEDITVVVVGKGKAESLKAAFVNEDTGLGAILKLYQDKVKIHIDAELSYALKHF